MNFNPLKYLLTKKFGTDVIKIRPAQISDRELVWNGYRQAPKDFFYHIPEITRENIDMWYPEGGKIDYTKTIPYNAMLLDENDKEIKFAGNATLIFHQIERINHVAIMGLGVLPPFQGRGLGKTLTDLLIKVAREKPGISRLELEVCTKNTNARQIYLKCGFHEEGILRKRWHYPDGEYDDIIIMSIIFPEKFT
ncbi:MAG: GNAT family N-acetyltransferase [Candidatus Hermodarchaeota archaeon]